MDSVNGDDGSTGKKPSEAFQTIAALTSISAGDTIGLARGSEWREQLTVTVENVSIKAYGPGARPILRCDNVINSGWSKTGGYTNIYQVTLSTNYDPGDPTFQSVWEDDTRLTLAASLAALDSAPGSYYCANHSTTTPVIYVHATGSGNPAANGKVYEMPVRNYGIYGVNHTTIKGIHTLRNLATGGSIKCLSYANISDCLVEDGNKHNLYFGTGSYLNGVIAQRFYTNETNTMFVLNADTPNNEGCTLINCQAIDGGSAYYGHVNVSGNFGTVTLIDCQAVNCVVGVNFSSASVVLQDCDIEGLLYGIEAGENYTITGGSIKGANHAIFFQAGSLTISCNGTSLRNTANPTNSCIRALNKNSITLSLTDCTIISDTWVGINLEGGNNLTLTVNGCTFDCLVDLIHDGAQDPVFVFDNNLYKLREGTDDFYAAVGSPCAAYTFAQWQGLGYDLNSSTYT